MMLTPSWHLVLSLLAFAFVHKDKTTPPTCDIFTVPDHFTELWHHRIGEVSTEYIQRMWHVNNGRWLLRTPGTVPLWDLRVFLCWDQSILNVSCSWTFEFRTSLGTSILLIKEIQARDPYAYQRSIGPSCRIWNVNYLVIINSCLMKYCVTSQRHFYYIFFHIIYTWMRL